MTTVSVIVPIFNEAAHIEECVKSIAQQRGQGFSVEILVVDGMSSDGTREVVAKLQQANPAIQLLDNPKRTVPFAMNIGIEASSGPVIIRLDGHAAMEPDFVAESLATLAAHPECGCVGGHIANIPETAVAESISLAMGSKFGVGSAHFRTGNFEGYVDTVAFGAYRKEVFDQIGVFDTALTRNQDDELNYRLTQAGWKIWLSKAIKSRYYVRGNFGKLYRQYFQYGYWKVYVNRKHKAVTSVRQLVPFLFVSFLACAPVLLLLHKGLFFAWIVVLDLYLLANLFSALGQNRNPVVAVRVAWSCSLMHVGYGLGYWLGIVHFAIMGRNPSEKQEEISR